MLDSFTMKERLWLWINSFSVTKLMITLRIESIEAGETVASELD